MSSGSVLILGGASDIGMAIARRFAAEGFDIKLAARETDALSENASDISLRHGVKTSVHQFDATNLDQAAPFFMALDPLPDVVVSVVGWLGEQDKTAADPVLVRRAVETNFLGTAWILEVAAAELEKAGKPSCIIGVRSVAGDRGRATNYWYGASKAGLTAFLSGLRQKYVRSNVHVITVKPGFVATRMTAGMDLPGPLTASSDEIGQGVFKAWKKRRNIVYIRGVWRLVMGIIRLLPESIFKKTKF